MAKQILFGSEALNKFAKGAKTLNDAVTITMGAKGQNVLIEDGMGSRLPHVTKDGVTVAKSVDLKDTVENVACSLIKQVALRTNELVGDGTTTATSLSNAIIQEGVRAIQEDGVHPIMLKRGLDIQLKEVLKDLEKFAVSIDIKDTDKVAYISANGDREIAELVSNVYKEIGKDGNVAIEATNNSAKSYYEKVEGIKFDRGYTTPYFVTNPKMTAEYENVSVLICDYVINDVREIVHVLEMMTNGKKKALLIICEDVSNEVEQALVKNKMAGKLDVVVVKAPEFGDRRLDALEDMAILTNGTFVSTLTGISLPEIKKEHLGQCDKIIVDAENTAIIGGAGTKEKIQERLDYIKERIDNTEDKELKKFQEKRHASIKGGIVVIKVGGNSDVEILEIKDRVEDAVNAVKSSLLDGIIPGGGIPLLRIGDKGFKEADLSKHSEHINKGRLVLLKAIKLPFRQIVKNGGLPVEGIEKEVLNKSKNMVFDVMSENYKDGFKHGIIDPLLVTKTALINAVSVAGTLLTTGCTINYEPENSKPIDFSLPG